MTLKELNSMSRKELENILITCDGAGKSVKQDVLDEIIDRVLDEIINRATMNGWYSEQESQVKV